MTPPRLAPARWSVVVYSLRGHGPIRRVWRVQAISDSASAIEDALRRRLGSRHTALTAWRPLTPAELRHGVKEMTNR